MLGRNGFGIEIMQRAKFPQNSLLAVASADVCELRAMAMAGDGEVNEMKPWEKMLCIRYE